MAHDPFRGGRSIPWGAHVTRLTSTISGLIAPNRRYVRLVWPLSFGQLVSWGAVYYSFTLFLETSWPNDKGQTSRT